MKIEVHQKTMYCDLIDIRQWTAAPLRISSTVMINATPNVVFHILSDPAMMCQVFSWMERVTVTFSSTNRAQVTGALRTCVLGNGLVLEEEIVDWQPPQGYAFRGIDATHPFGMRGHVGVLSFASNGEGCCLVWQHQQGHVSCPG